MGLGIAKVIRKINIRFKLINLSVIEKIFGFEYINNKLPSLEKELIIPVLLKHGAEIGDGSEIETGLIINSWNKNDAYKSLKIGKNVYIGKNVTLDIKGEVVIGDNVTISFGSVIISHIDIRAEKLSSVYKSTYYSTIIGKNTYLGANVIVLGGVKIGENILISAGSVVIKNLESNSVYGGNPTKFLKNFKII